MICLVTYNDVVNGCVECHHVSIENCNADFRTVTTRIFEVFNGVLFEFDNLKSFQKNITFLCVEKHIVEIIYDKER